MNYHQNKIIKSFLSAVMLVAFTGNASADVVASKSRADWKKEYVRPAETPFPEENPYSASKADLGHKLFFDPRLSGNNYISCGTCHNPSFAWGDGLPKGIGNAMTILGRRTPTILNLAWAESGSQQRRWRTAGNSRVSGVVQCQLSGRGDYDRDHCQGNRDVRADRRQRRCAIRSLDRRRRARDSGICQAWVRSVQRQGQLRRLPFGVELHRWQFSRYRPTRCRCWARQATAEREGDATCLQDPDASQLG